MARKRELIEPHKGDKRYVRHDERGRMKESDEAARFRRTDGVGRRPLKSGQGDKGDRPRAGRSR